MIQTTNDETSTQWAILYLWWYILWYITLNDLNWHWRRSPTQCATIWNASQLLWVNPLLATFLCMITLLTSVQRLFLWNEMGSLGWSNIIWSWWFPLLMLPPPPLSMFD
jgi:hypothetical protein